MNQFPRSACPLVACSRNGNRDRSTLVLILEPAMDAPRILALLDAPRILSLLMSSAVHGAGLGVVGACCMHFPPRTLVRDVAIWPPA